MKEPLSEFFYQSFHSLAGAYIHIPFCKQACIYCDFHFSTLEKDRGAMTMAIIKEAQLRKDFLPQQALKSIYFGGGTPSVVPIADIEKIIEALDNLYGIDASAEITLEANPDDLNEAYLTELSRSPVNRLSIGIQSFKEADLSFMNRAHSAKEAIGCLESLAKYGFDNYSIDLIYGLPNQSPEDWLWQMEHLKTFDIPHFSAYALTVESKTKLAYLQAKGAVELKDENAAKHFELLQDFAKKEGYEHYELSNFARPGKRAVHNGSYWEGTAYLGLGPSAHSYNGKERSWNVANNALYLKALEQDGLALEKEILEEKDRFNEMLMTRLRLLEGISEREINSFSPVFQRHWLKESRKLLATGKLVQFSEGYRIPSEWRFFSDGIAADLFYT